MREHNIEIFSLINYFKNMLDIQKYIGKPKIVYDVIDKTTSKFEVKYLPK
jgi:hypothetical protein